MANLSITPANVIPAIGVQFARGTAGATILAGQPLYLDSVTNTLKLADSNASAATSECVGVSVCGASAGQPIAYLSEDDDFTLGATGLVIGMVYVVSATAGSICPITDMTSGDYVTQIGTAKSSTKIKLFVAQITRASVPR
jgi:hypothetical protein